MFIDDWLTQSSRSLWYMMQEENPQTLRNILGNDHPTLALATDRFRTWIEKKKIQVPDCTDQILIMEMVSCALDEVDWHVLTYRIAQALDIPVSEVSDFIICPTCQCLICQLCLLCCNPSCGNAHQVDCLSENSHFQLGPILFDFTDYKLVVRIGETEMPMPHKEYERLVNWLHIRKNLAYLYHEPR